MKIPTSKFRAVIRLLIAETLQSHSDEPILGDMVQNVNTGCDHYGSEGEVIDIYALPDDMGTACEYECTNQGETWSIGDVLMKTLDQLEKIDVDPQFR